MTDEFKEMDKKELDFPDTVFVRDIESRVFQAIAVKSLADIKDISLLEGNLLDSLLGRDGHEKVKGIHVEQDQKNHSVTIKVELNVAYGISIPEKAEEIQSKITDEVCELTGLHVACVHVVFKNLISETIIDELEFQGEESLKQIEEVKEEDKSAFEYTEKS